MTTSGMEAKQLGMDLAASAPSHRTALEVAREGVFEAAREESTIDWRTNGTATADDAYDRLRVCGIPESALGNAAGSIFADREMWEPVGWRPSTRPSNHGRPIRVWRLRHAYR
jgi:hypothetical protein